MVSPGKTAIAWSCRHFGPAHDALAVTLVVAFERRERRKTRRKH